MEMSEIKQFLSKIKYPVLLEAMDGDWYREGSDYYYVQSGEVYNGYSTVGHEVDGDLHYVNLDGGMGYEVSCVFDTNKELTCESFYEKYGE